MAICVAYSRALVSNSPSVRSRAARKEGAGGAAAMTREPARRVP
jgi:hypothetical protein